MKNKLNIVHFKGTFTKDELYSLLECIDKLKTTGYEFAKHDRSFVSDDLTEINYVLSKY